MNMKSELVVLQLVTAQNTAASIKIAPGLLGQAAGELLHPLLTPDEKQTNRRVPPYNRI
jgi:hypothetical protein